MITSNTTKAVTVAGIPHAVVGKPKTIAPTKIIIDTASIYGGAKVYTQGLVAQETDTVKMVDVLMDSNVPETHLISPTKGKNMANSTASAKWFHGLKEAVEDGYPDDVKALLAMSSRAAGNTFIGLNNRTGWRNKANSVIGGMRTAMINRMKRDEDIAKGLRGANDRTKPVEVKVMEALTDGRARMQKAENFNCSIPMDEAIASISFVIDAIGKAPRFEDTI